MVPVARALVLAAAAAALLVAPATGLANTWATPTTSGQDGLGGAPHGVPLGPATYAVAAARPTSVSVVHTAAGRPTTVTQRIFDAGTGTEPVLASDSAGNGLAAWYASTDRSIDVTPITPDGQFGAPVVVSSGPAVPTPGVPLLALSPLGWAAVMFVAADASGPAVYVAVRPPGHDFGPAEPITTPSSSSAGNGGDGGGSASSGNGGGSASGGPEPASLAIDDRGDAVAGYLQSDVAYAALRAGGSDGTWAPPAALGGPWPGLVASRLAVGIDASGGAVAAWDEAGADKVDPLAATVLAAFRPAGGPFGTPQGLAENDTRERFSLAVSGLGEVILAVHPLDAPTHHLQPVTVSSGSTVLGRFWHPEPIAQTWDEFNPLVAINARGDAVLTTDKENTSELIARRRPPFGEFGAAEEIVPPPYGPISSTADPDGMFRTVADVGVDSLGDAIVTWTDDASLAPVAISVDGPRVTSVPEVSLPDPLGLTELVAPDPPAKPGPDHTPAPPDVPALLTPPAVGRLTPVPAPAARRPQGDGRPVAVFIQHAPPSTGTPRIVVAVRCPAACRAGLDAVLTTPSGRTIILPAVALTLDTAGSVHGSVKITPAAARALRTPSTGPAARRPARRFQLTVTATAGDASGAQQTARASVTFTRR